MKKDWMIRESELDDDQLSVLQATLDKSCVVSGCAGSGKSVLALIKAQRIQNERSKDYQVIVYTKALARYMNSGREALGLKQAFTYHWDWVNKKHCPSSEYVIVDEIQDFTKEEVLAFIGAASKQFFFYGDSAQSLYHNSKPGGTMKLEDIQGVCADDNKPKLFPLYRNYRLPKPVARLVQHVGIDLDSFEERTYKSVESAVPRLLQYTSIQEQISAIVRIVKNAQLRDVAILLPHNELVLSTAQALDALGLSVEMKYNNKENWRENVENLNFSSDNPKVMTYHSAKGLQFEAVFLPCLEEYNGSNEDAQRALYVAMTRTYRSLYMMYSGELPSVLSSIPRELYKVEEVDTIEDI